MPGAKKFYLYSPTRTIEGFTAHAEAVAPLKAFGPVEIAVGHAAEATRADVPAGGSHWHDYTSTQATWQKVFPHPKMQPFLDAEHIRKNRALLADSLKVVRRLGCSAVLRLHTPFFLPEKFFEAYPQMRGPRCDHPRRSREEAFALCVDHPESLQMYSEMAAQIGREIPELSMIQLITNDAGAGLCWGDNLYPGPNGPSHCRHISTASRIRTLAQTVRKGLALGHPVDVQCLGNFSESEFRETRVLAGDEVPISYHGCFNDLKSDLQLNDVADNPIANIFNPVALLERLERAYYSPAISRLMINPRYAYQRGSDSPELIQKVVEVTRAYFEEPPAKGILGRLSFLRKLCGKWVGEQKSDELLEIFVALAEAVARKQNAAAMVNCTHFVVSMRYINRPLVICPELLSAEEEAYFLPHVFNVHVNEGRRDYRDFHGGVMEFKSLQEMEANGVPRVAPLAEFSTSLRQIASGLEQFHDRAGFFPKMTLSVRMLSSFMRSCNNFLVAGALRDRNREKLSGPPHLPPKVGDWTGDPDLLLLNATMRDELDNAVELQSLLERGGLELLNLARRAEDEDTFLLGPNLLEQVKAKTAIMRRHWLDAERFMSTPHK